MASSIAELLPEYFANLREDAARIEEMLPEGRFEEIVRVGHQLKGSGASYGFPRLSEIGADIEAAARAGELEPIAELTEILKRCIEECRADALS